MEPHEQSRDDPQQGGKGSLPWKNNEENSLEDEKREKLPDEIERADDQVDLHNPNRVSMALIPQWKAGKGEWMIIIVMAIVSLMVAIDATILVPALPVGSRMFYSINVRLILML